MSAISNQFNLTPAHYIPTPDDLWMEVESTDYARDDGRPYFLKDLLTGDRYLNESNSIIRFKCCAITLINPFSHIPAALIMTTLLIVRTVASLFILQCFNNHPTVTEREWAQIDNNLSRLAHLPFVLFTLVLAPIYGLYDPRNGRKLYATAERDFYHSSVVATCFQPSRDSKEGYQRVGHGNYCYVN